jgi:hypothetical protein
VLLSTADDQPVPYGTIAAENDTRGWFTNAAGRFVLPRTNETYRLRARQIGFAPLDTTVRVAADTAHIVLRLQPLAIRPEALAHGARTERSCVATGIPNISVEPAIAAVFAMLRENGDRYQILLDRYPFRHRWQERRFIRVQSGTDVDDSALVVDTVDYDSRSRRGYRIGASVYAKRSKGRETQLTMFLPTPRDFTDSLFQAEHCFTYRGTSHREIRIDFRPLDQIAVPDVVGSIYLDSARYIVRRAVFELTHPGAIDPPIQGFTVTATFDEIATLVPILARVYGEQQLPRTHRFGGAAGMTVVDRAAIVDNRMINHAFLGAAIGEQSAPLVTPGPAPATIVCALPPSYVSNDVLIYGTLDGPDAADRHAPDVIDSIRTRFRLPSDVALPVYGYAVGLLVAPTIGAQVTFSVDPDGHVTQITVTATSLSPTIDSSLVAAVRRADSARVLQPLQAGAYTLSLSALSPISSRHATAFAHLKAPAFHLERGATLDPDSTQPTFPTDRPIEFVVDEQGRGVLATARMTTASPDTLSEAAVRALPRLRFRPALIGGCRVKQQVLLPSVPQ